MTTALPLYLKATPMKRMRIPLVLSLASVLAISGCKKDEEAPLITINSPANHSDFAMGSSIAVDATFEDERELKSYKVFIGTEDGEPTSDFSFSQEGELTGKSFEYSASITIPDNIDFIYYLHFEVTDKKDNVGTANHMLHFHE